MLYNADGDRGYIGSERYWCDSGGISSMFAYCMVSLWIHDVHCTVHKIVHRRSFHRRVKMYYSHIIWRYRSSLTLKSGGEELNCRLHVAQMIYTLVTSTRYCDRFSALMVLCVTIQNDLVTHMSVHWDIGGRHDYSTSRQCIQTWRNVSMIKPRFQRACTETFAAVCLFAQNGRMIAKKVLRDRKNED